MLLVVALTGCGSGVNLARTKLTLTAVNPDVGQAISTSTAARPAAMSRTRQRLALLSRAIRARHVAAAVQLRGRGIRRTFPPGTLRQGDILVCTIRHHRLQLSIPAGFGPIGSTGFGGRDIVSVTLTGTRHPGGSVTAGCGSA